MLAGAEWRRASEAGLKFRPVADSDLPFLAQVYASTRAEEIAVVPWSAQQKAAFLDMQFRAQHSHYQQHYPAAERLVILRRAEQLGRLYLDRGEREHSIIDIALLPDYRRRGYGTALLQDLLDEAAAAGKAVEIYVEKFNPALRLYRRLGFVPVEEQGVYDRMRWTPPPL